MGNHIRNDALITTTLVLFLAFASIAPYFNVVKAGSCQYHINVMTGHMANAGTDARVTLKLYDAQGHMFELTDLQKYFVPNPFAGDRCFEINQLDYFRVRNDECHTHEICKIELSHDNSGQNPGWYVDYLRVETQYPGDVYPSQGRSFEINQWLDKGQTPYSLSLQKDLCRTPKNKVKKSLCQHEITVKTGNATNAGTDAWVILKLYDSHGHMFQLNNLQTYGTPVPGSVEGVTTSSDYFEKNDVNYFRIIYRCRISNVCKIELSHDNSGEHPGWYVDYVRVQSSYEGDLLFSEDITFNINQWLDIDEEPRSLSVKKDLCG